MTFFFVTLTSFDIRSIKDCYSFVFRYYNG